MAMQHKGIRVRTPKNRIVTISHANHSAARSAQYPYYYAGGNIGSVHFKAGHYNCQFWLWTYVMTVSVNDSGQYIDANGAVQNDDPQADTDTGYGSASDTSYNPPSDSHTSAPATDYGYSPPASSGYDSSSSTPYGGGSTE